MSILIIDGFDLYNGTGANTGLSAKWTPSSTVSMAMATGRFGDQCVNLGSTGRNIQRSFTAGANVGVGFAVKYGTNPSVDGAFTNLMALLSGTTYTFGLRVTSTGAIEARRMTSSGAGTVLGTSAAGVILSSTWQFVEVGVVINDTTGSVTVKVDGTTVLSLTSQDTNNAVTTVDTIQLGCSANTAGQGIGQFDDFYLVDSATTLGERRVETKRAAADTAQKDFSPLSGTDNNAMVDDTTANGDTDYVQASSVGNTDLYTFGTLSSTPSAISAVQITAFAEKTDASSRSIALQVKSGATTSDGSNFALAASYGKFDRILETDPNTSAAWTASGVNNLQAGPKVTV
jgi:hypothetical protein